MGKILGNLGSCWRNLGGCIGLLGGKEGKGKFKKKEFKKRRRRRRKFKRIGGGIRGKGEIGGLARSRFGIIIRGVWRRMKARNQCKQKKKNYQ